MKLDNLNTEFIGRNVIYFDAVDSTQTYAKELKDAENGTVVIAGSQTDGIGTHDRKWYTGRGTNIAMTFILYPNCNINKLSNLTRVVSECINKATENLYGYKLGIKEPNDIVYNNKKIGGILTETITEGEVSKKLLIGVGLNVNQEIFPGTLSEIASSLKNEFGKELSREDIISEFFNVFEREYLQIIN